MTGTGSVESDAGQRQRIRRVGAWLCAGFILPLAALDYLGFHPLWKAERYTEDLRLRNGRAAALDPRFVFLAIDQPDYGPLLLPEELAAEPVLGELAGWPWPRSVYAALIERLAKAGASVIAVDLLLVSPGRGDDELAAVLARHGDRVVLGGLLAERDAAGNAVEQLMLPAVAADPAAMGADRAGTVGFVNVYPDPDGVVRRVVYRRDFAGYPVESFAAQILRKLGAGAAVPRAGTGYRLRLAGPPGASVPTIPFYHAFLPKTWTGALGEGAFFRDKVVIVGPLGEWAKDTVNTPYPSPMPGPEFHAAAVNAAWHGGFFREAGALLRLALILGAGAAGWAGLVWSRRTRRGTLVMLGAAAGYVVLAFVVQDTGDWIFPVVTPLLALAGAHVIYLGTALYLERQARQRIRHMFSRMVSPEVLSHMLSDASRFRLVGERTDATIFFSDLEGFTAIAENLPPEDLARVLNRYFTPMSEIILRHRGYIDKYEGDAIMADFGVPVWADLAEPRSHAWRACWAALEQRERLRQLQVEFARDFGVPIEMRIGVCTGTVSAGNMGSEQKFQYTVMGDTVNQAARLEPANKLFGTRILIAESTFEAAHEHIEARFVGVLLAKGKSRLVRCYELLARRGELAPERVRAGAAFAAGWALHAERKFEEALKEFNRTLELAPDDEPARRYVQLCRHYLRNPPPGDWAGELVQVSKD